MSEGHNQCCIEETDRLFTIEEVAQLLSFTPKSIYQLVHRRVIPFTKISGALRFRKSDIDKWIEDNTYAPQPKEKKKDFVRVARLHRRQISKNLTDIDRAVEHSRRKYMES
ncbi:MAG: helix-turn-helix domain-containing protein [Deltaproteobacteria bacterium]